MVRLDVAPHLTADEIEERYRHCRDAAEKTIWHLLWLTRPDPTPADPWPTRREWSASPCGGRGRSPTGTPAVGRTPWPTAGGSTGAASKLTPERQAELFAALQSPPRDGGLWSGPKVIAFVRDRWAVAVGNSTGGQ